MKIIDPYQITGEILALINRAEKFLVLVSPYVDFKNWYAIKKEIMNAQKRGVEISFYVRFEPDNYKSWKQIEQLGITPKLIKNLHAKLYYNERTGIATSMNLLVSSNLNAIEFGSIYDTEEELNVLKDFVNRFLKPNAEEEKFSEEDDVYLTKEKITNTLCNVLSKKLDRSIYCKWEQQCYALNANNQFYFGIDGMKNVFWIQAIISGWERENSVTFIQNTPLRNVANFEVGENSIVAVLNDSLSSNFIDYLKLNEKRKILDIIVGFVLEWLDFKQYCYDIRYSRQQ